MANQSTGDYVRPDDPADARLVALPMRPGVLGVPVEVRAYVQLPGALGSGGYRDESLGLSGAASGQASIARAPP